MNKEDKKILPIVECFCLWEDLLGFGKPFVDNNWNVECKEVQDNINRLALLQEQTHHISDVFVEKVFTLNDGFARTYDLYKNNVILILKWLENVIICFDWLNRSDVNNGHCGVRGVLAYGKRVMYSMQQLIGMGEFIMMSDEKKQHYNKTSVVYAPAELQMNTAFSKAYIIESGGSIMGLKGNHLFIDVEVILRVATLINSIGFDEFPRINDESSSDCLVYKYEAEADLDGNNPSFFVTATAGSEKWVCFRIEFQKAIEYTNEKSKIYTQLVIPTRIFSGYTSPRKETHGTVELHEPDRNR